MLDTSLKVARNKQTSIPISRKLSIIFDIRIVILTWFLEENQIVIASTAQMARAPAMAPQVASHGGEGGGQSPPTPSKS